jgi:hypothetical protein
MGSNFMTCALTGVPITTYDEATLVFTAMNPEHHREGRQISITQAWAPLTLPIPAAYADYGDFEFANPHPGLDMLRDALGSQVTSFIGDVGMFRKITDHKLHVETNEACPGDGLAFDKAPVSYMCMHRRAFELLSASTADGDTHADIVAAMPAFFEPFLKIDSEASLRAHSFRFDPLLHWFFEGTSSSSCPDVHTLRYVRPTYPIKKMIWTALRGGKDWSSPRLSTLADSLAQMICLMSWMDAQNIMFTASPSASNDYDADMARQLFNIGQDIWSE